MHTSNSLNSRKNNQSIRCLDAQMSLWLCACLLQHSLPREVSNFFFFERLWIHCSVQCYNIWLICSQDWWHNFPIVFKIFFWLSQKSTRSNYHAQPSFTSVCPLTTMKTIKRCMTELVTFSTVSYGCDGGRPTALVRQMRTTRGPFSDLSHVLQQK